MANNKFKFSKYLIGWLIYLPANLIGSVLIGLFLGLTLPNLNNMTLTIISIISSLLILYGVGYWRNLNFLIFLLFNIIASILLMAVLLLLVLVIAIVL